MTGETGTDYWDTLWDDAVAERLRPEPDLPALLHAEVERVTYAYAVTSAVALVPKRLGQDSSPAERRADKLLARRVANCYRNCARLLHVEEYLTTSPADYYAEGAKMHWTTWLEAVARHIDSQRRVAWTAGVLAGDAEWAKKSVHRLDWEAAELQRVFGLAGFETPGWLAPVRGREAA